MERFCSVAMLSAFLSAELLLSKQIMGQDEKNILPCHNKGIRKFYKTFIVLNRGGSRKFFLGGGGGNTPLVINNGTNKPSTI